MPAKTGPKPTPKTERHRPQVTYTLDRSTPGRIALLRERHPWLTSNGAVIDWAIQAMAERVATEPRT